VEYWAHGQREEGIMNKALMILGAVLAVGVGCLFACASLFMFAFVAFNPDGNGVSGGDWVIILLPALMSILSFVAAVFLVRYAARVGRVEGAIMKKTLVGALVGFLAAPVLAFVVMTARLCNDYNPLNHAMILACMYSPFWAVPGLVIGAVVGAIIGSGWKAKTPDAVVARPQQGVISLGDMLKPQPRQAKCPFCHSSTFRVVEETGSRRCGDCHSVLPNYILGNAQSTGQM
jgi:hypothetical protein